MALVVGATAAGWLATDAPARSSDAAQASARACAGGSIQEVPYFTVRAHRTTCGVAQHLIRAFLCVNSRGNRCEPHEHWYSTSTDLYGRWTSRSGWHCMARFPVPVNEDGRPYGSLRCRRASAWISAQVFG